MKEAPIDRRTYIYRQVPIMIAVGFILLGCVIILKPFIPAILLACILCLSTWPAFSWLEVKLKGRTNLAALLMTLLVAACFLAPLIFLGGSLAESFSALIESISKSVNSDGVMATPLWAKDIPFVGPYLDDFWRAYLSDQRQLMQTVSDHSALVTQWLIAIGAIIGHGVFDISLGVVLAFFLFRHGPTIVRRAHNLMENFGGGKGRHLLQICARTVIGVVYGILGTALVFAALITIGFWIAHVPGAPFLGLVTFLLSIIPSGPYFILVPVTAWLFMEGHPEMGAFMGLWSFVIVILFDFLVRPVLIARGSKMPIVIVLLGIFGGIATFGFIGIFIGPALLAIALALINEWSGKRSD